MRVKIDKRDTVFSFLVRERAEHTCEQCGKYCGEKHEYGKLECSHIFSRRHHSIRWHPDNATAQCHTCHRKYHEDPWQAQRWLIDMHGQGYMDLLEEKKNTIAKFSKVVKEDIHKHLKGEYSRMMGLRESGHTGRIEFEAFT